MTSSRWVTEAEKLRIFSRAEPGRCIAAPCVTLAIYSAAPLAQLCSPLAEIVASYLSLVPPGAIKAIYEPGGDDDDEDYFEGYFRPFDADARQELMDDLRSQGPARGEFYSLMLTGGENGEGAEYGVRFQGSHLPQPSFPNKRNLLRLDCAPGEVDRDLDRYLEFVVYAFEAFPAVTGTCALGFGYTYEFDPEAREHINALAMRFLGADLTYDFMNLKMGGKVAPINWITHVGHDLPGNPAELVLGGSLPPLDLRRTTTGVVIRAAAVPALGDVNRLAPDVGLIPALSRVLKSRTYDNTENLGITDPDLAERWLNRFDNVSDRPWDNGSVTS